MFPDSLVGKFVAVIWFSACLTLLYFAYLQQDIHDMPVAVLWLTLFLTAPIGILIIGVAEITTTYISGVFGLTYHPFLSLLPTWFLAVSIGYIQWFVVVPKLYYWCKTKWKRT